MNEEKEIKKSQPYSLKPTNIIWLAQQALSRSTPEKRVSASLVLDELIDAAREAQKSQLEKKIKSTRTSVPALAA